MQLLIRDVDKSELTILLERISKMTEEEQKDFNNFLIGVEFAKNLKK